MEKFQNDLEKLGYCETHSKMKFRQEMNRVEKKKMFSKHPECPSCVSILTKPGYKRRDFEIGDEIKQVHDCSNCYIKKIVNSMNARMDKVLDFIDELKKERKEISEGLKKGIKEFSDDFKTDEAKDQSTEGTLKIEE